jgi:hypothetical protein
MINLSPFLPQDAPVSDELFLARIREWIASMTAEEIGWILAYGSAQDFVAHFQSKGILLDGNPEGTWRTFCAELTARLTHLSVFSNAAGTS